MWFCHAISHEPLEVLSARTRWHCSTMFLVYNETIGERLSQAFIHCPRIIESSSLETVNTYDKPRRNHDVCVSKVLHDNYCRHGKKYAFTLKVIGELISRTSVFHANTSTYRTLVKQNIDFKYRNLIWQLDLSEIFINASNRIPIGTVTFSVQFATILENVVAVLCKPLHIKLQKLKSYVPTM